MTHDRTGAYAAAARIHTQDAIEGERLAVSKIRRKKLRAAREEHERTLRQWAWATMWLLLWALEDA